MKLNLSTNTFGNDSFAAIEVGKVLLHTQQHAYKPYSKRYKCSAVLGHPVIRVDLLPHW